MKSLALFLLAALLCTGCAWRKPKNGARMYEGDAPTIKYSEEREVAGGPLGGR